MGSNCVSESVARLIVEARPNSGAWNMAVDAALLESAVHRGCCTVRVYRWSEPTVSMGYFQRDDAIDAASPWAALPRVRRLSGGGAILHHHEWTYSCAVPAGHPAIRTPHALYETVHRRIIAVLEECSVKLALRGDAERAAGAGRSEASVSAADSSNRGIASAGRSSPGHPSTQATAKPFLCFSRGDARDIVLQGHKIVGSAQRRRKGAVLQHGSILLRASPFAPHLPGIADLSEEFETAESLGECLGRSIALPVAGSIDGAELTAEELAAATRVAER
jgi:lipoate-protein ligase A